jgi:hypothetical protein
MSSRRTDSDGHSEPPDCRYRDRSIVHEPDRSDPVAPSERSRRSTPTAASDASPDRFGRSVLSVSGMAVLTVTKLLDALTTGVGLLHLPGVYEANPLVASVLHETGVVIGLAVASVAIIAGITLVVESCSILVSVRRRDGHLAPVVRFVGYGLPSVIFAAISVHNASVLLSGVQAAVPL